MKIKSLLIAATFLPLVATGAYATVPQNEDGRQQLKQIAQKANSACPIEAVQGMVLDSVTYSGNAFSYHYRTSDQNFNSLKNNAMLKEALIGQLQNTPFTDVAILLYENNSSLSYIYYTGDGRNLQVTFSSGELKTNFGTAAAPQDQATKTLVLENMAKAEQANLPMTISEDISITSVKYEGNVFQYTYLVSSQLLATLDREAVKKNTMVSLRQNPNFKQIGELYVATNTLLRYRYTTATGQSLDIDVTAAEIQSLLQSQSNADECKQLLQHEAQSLNAICPKVVDERMTISSVTYDNNTFKYVYTISDNNAILQTTDEELRQIVASQLKQNDPNGIFITTITNAGATLTYSYRTASGKARDITFTPQELKQLTNIKSQSEITLEVITKMLNEKCPIENGDMTILKASYDNHTFQMELQLPDEVLESPDINSIAKSAMIQMLSMQKELHKLIIEANAKAVFKFQSKSGKLVTVEISNQELKELD